MIRGTTPLLTFTLPFDVSKATDVWVTFSQNNTEVFTILTDELTIAENVIDCRLNQQQTLALKAGVYVEMQIRVAFDNENYKDALASDIMRTTVQRILKDGEI